MRYLVIFSLLFFCITSYSAMWLYPGQSTYIPLQPGQIIRYIEVEWSSMGGNPQGLLYYYSNSSLYHVPNSAINVGTGYYYGNTIIPDYYFFEINRRVDSAYITIFNDVAKIYNILAQPITINPNPIQYNANQEIAVSFTPNKIIRYIEIDADPIYSFSNIVLRIDGFEYTANTIMNNTSIEGYYVPRLYRWIINRVVYSELRLIVRTASMRVYSNPRVVYTATENMYNTPFNQNPYYNQVPYPYPVNGQQWNSNVQPGTNPSSQAGSPHIPQ